MHCRCFAGAAVAVSVDDSRIASRHRSWFEGMARRSNLRHRRRINVSHNGCGTCPIERQCKRRKRAAYQTERRDARQEIFLSVSASTSCNRRYLPGPPPPSLDRCSPPPGLLVSVIALALYGGQVLPLA
jgi:hypothetical protein